ncbi:phospholipase D-like domain-containing protein [Aquabacterium commune]|uniref:phospholipase D-like domain-containing protein n=1 Tax=Aquabacterium commune TaxID=70586 RepID=UPI001414D7D8|nr:phosphatidylserine/phosphatidylglycerophosphate/cardiolipin synthase family protein [Aquabacterium commune]
MLLATAAETSPPSSTFSTYFNHRPEASFVEPHRGTQREGNNFEQVIVQRIAAARTRIDVAVMGITLPHIAQALTEAARRGVQVRVVMDNSFRRNWAALTPDEVASLSDADKEVWAEVDSLVDVDGDGEASDAELAANDVATILAQAGIPVIDDTEDGSKGSGLMHHKFAVFDDEVVLTGSANWTHSGFFGDIGRPASRGNAENLVEVRHAEVAQAYAQEFALMWGDGPGGMRNSRFGIAKGARAALGISTRDGLVQLQFSPFSASKPLSSTTIGLIDSVLKVAVSRIDLGAFVLTDATLTDTMAQRAAKGVMVRGLFDQGYAFNDFSATLDMWGVRLLDAACALKPQLRPWSVTPMAVGYPVLPEGDKLHHKVAVVDDHTVVAGSMNWSAAALRSNDENVLIVHSPFVAAAFRQELDRLHASAVYGPSPALRARAIKDAQRCTTTQ